VSRTKAFWHGVLLGAPAAMLVVATVAVFSALAARPGSLPSGLVEASVWILVLPLPLLALLLGLVALRWLLLAFWPASIGVCAKSDFLNLAFGPFGTKRLNAEELDIRYPFDCEDDEVEDERTFEAFLPEEKQIQMFLPRISHPSSTALLDRRILKFTGLEEEEAAAKLAPVILLWRGDHLKGSA
jgi:hypothetical protein